jgi:hypothetical protein
MVEIKKSWLLSVLFVILLCMTLILAEIKTLAFSEYKYTYTRIVCSIPENNISYCQDAIVSCKGDKVISVKLIGKPVMMNYRESLLGWCEG